MALVLENTNYSIAILSFNHPELTAATVNSVLSKGFPSAKIYLVHNGSEIKHQNSLVSQFSKIRHIFLKENKGYSGGANAALSEVFKTEERLLFLTNDTEVLQLNPVFPDHLDLFSVSILKRNSNYLDSIIGSVNLKTGQLTHIKSEAELASLPPLLRTYVPGTAFGITKKTYVTIGGFDETLHTYWEDVDLSLRAHASKGEIRIGFYHAFQVKHKMGKTCHKHRFYTLYLFQRNKKRILKKYGSSRVVFNFYFITGMN